MANFNRIASLVSDLSKMNPYDPEVVRVINKLSTELESNVAVELDPDQLLAAVKDLHFAAKIPANNYNRVASITSGLAQAIELSKRPQFAGLRSQIASIVQKVAGIFSEYDLADEISSHTLEEIEAAVHKLYSNGATNKPSTYYFEARGKGFRSKSDK